MKIGKESSFLISRKETISQFCRREPFPIFLFTIKRSTFKEVFPIIEWHNNSCFPIPFNHLRWPCEQLFPVFSFCIIRKDSFPIYTNNIVNTFSIIRVNRVSVESNYIRFVRTEIDIFHSTLCLDFIYEFNGTAISGF